jgi:aminopeptidase N
MLAQLLSLPSEAYLSELADEIDVVGIHTVREYLLNTLAKSLESQFAALHQALVTDAAYAADADGIARRSLSNICLAYLMRTNKREWIDLCQQQFARAANMTDVNAALRLLVNNEAPAAQQLKQNALQQFLEKWRHEALVVDQWFSVQATATVPGTLQQVKALLGHDMFDMRNPNKVRSLIGAFSSQNAINFHDISGAGYAFLGDKILELNRLNPQIASRLLTPLTRWKKYDAVRQQLMKTQLERIAAEENLSKDVYEVVIKSLV